MSAYTIDVATIATITKAAGLLLIPGLPGVTRLPSQRCPTKWAFSDCQSGKLLT